MFLIILLFVSILVAVVGFILEKKYKFNDHEILNVFMSFATIAGIAFGVICAIAIPIEVYTEKLNINQFKQQQAYLENHIVENDIENAALTTKKLELNEWLYDAQYDYTHYHMFSFYDGSIMKLEPIE